MKIEIVIAVVMMGMLAVAWPVKAQSTGGAPTAEKLGWRLGCQAYSFNKFTFFEAVDKTAEAGLHYIEAYPGQTFSPEKKDAKFDHNMSPELQAEALAKLKAKNIKLVNYGVVGLGDNEKEARKVFDFAKAMGIETIVSEPAEKDLPMLDKLAQEYKINVAIHNHPKESHYWNPDVELKAFKGCSKRIGACADTGHWMRSNVQPLEALKKLEGRIISFHFKDLNEFGNKEAHDVPWGTGQGNTKALLTEIKRQKIKAVFSIEYEYNWENSVPEIKECVANFEKFAQELSK